MRADPPCDTCVHVFFMPSGKKDVRPSCKLNFPLGNPICSCYKRDPSLPKLELPMPVSAYGAPAFVPDFYEREAALPRKWTEEEIRELMKQCCDEKAKKDKK